MSRRSPGEGCVSRRKDGRWQGALQLGGQRHTVYGKTRSEVADKLRKLAQTAESTGRLPTNPKQTVAEYFASWLAQAQSYLRPTTLADYTVMVNKHIVPTLGATRLSRLTALQVAKYQAAMAESLSPRRVRMVHDLLHKALGDAHRWGLLGSNPIALVTAPKREERRPSLWTPAQVAAFAAYLLDGQGGSYGPLLLYLLASGCRIGEALGLHLSDVDLDAGTVTIRRQLVQIGKTFHEGAPKTRSGVRTVALPEFGVQALRQQKGLNAEHRLRQGANWPFTPCERGDGVKGWHGEGERIFLTEVGTIPSRNNVKRALHNVCHRLGLSKIRPHDLRHISLSLLAMSGVPVKVAQARAGHSTASVTLNIYQHGLGDGDKLAAEALQKVLKGVAL